MFCACNNSTFYGLNLHLLDKSCAGKDSTLLIHEATFEDGMEEEAKEKHHRYSYFIIFNYKLAYFSIVEYFSS